jgi:hypothetical protein
VASWVVHHRVLATNDPTERQRACDNGSVIDVDIRVLGAWNDAPHIMWNVLVLALWLAALWLVVRTSERVFNDHRGKPIALLAAVFLVVTIAGYVVPIGALIAAGVAVSRTKGSAPTSRGVDVPAT